MKIYKLNPETKFLEQQPEMKEPEHKGLNLSGALSFEVAMNKYNEQKAKCKSYPISGIVPPEWEGKELVEDVDFEISTARIKPNYNEQTIVAVPIVKEVEINNSESQYTFMDRGN